MIQKLAILLTCHNRREKTLICLRSLYNCYLPDNYIFDVFLVDDGSTDGTSEAVKETYPSVNVISGSGNLYWNRGMFLAWETAAKASEYDFYLWLNDDTFLFNTAIQQLIRCSQQTKNKQIIVGATQSALDNAITYSGFLKQKKIVEPSGTLQHCDYFNGNIVLIPSKVYNLLGNLDNHFQHALGDFDYGLRAAKKNILSKVAPLCLGKCEAHLFDPSWRNQSVPLYKRFHHLYSPTGCNPFEIFIYDKRHNGLLLAIFHFFTIHYLTFFPWIWKREK